MKTLKSIFVILTLVLFSSCDKKETLVDKIMDTTNYEGGALRTIQLVNSDIALGNLTSKFEVVVEVQDVNNGANTTKIQVYSSFTDNTPVNGSNTKAETLITEIPASAFYAGVRELPYARVSVPLSELLSKLNLTSAQYLGGDRFTIRLAQVLNDGRVLTNTNSNSNVVGGVYFSSPFSYNANVVCPITESLAGTHSYVSTNMKRGSAGTPCGGTVSGTVTWANTATAGVYTNTDYSFGQFGACWNDNPATSAAMRVTWVCKSLNASGADQFGDTYTFTITSCVGPTLTLNWVNTYNDSGTTVITRQGGLNWPTVLQQ